ncbi:hypothetical protein [Streptomyces sp. NPDC007904]|uniref:hypothetical protein n=1 Tax=Streptomyces sp. NPDC007904 TaxID=3364787 RepID=UPI0036EE5A9B
MSPSVFPSPRPRSDFPNIPYPYVHQLHSLERLGLGADWLRAVCHDNAARLFGLLGRAGHGPAPS